MSNKLSSLNHLGRSTENGETARWSVPRWPGADEKPAPSLFLCLAPSSGPSLSLSLQSVPVPPLAPVRPPAPVPGLAAQTKTLCLAQFN